MDIEELQENTKVMEEATKAIVQLTKIFRCVLEYQNGTSADCCMQEISRIAIGEIL